MKEIDHSITITEIEIFAITEIATIGVSASWIFRPGNEQIIIKLFPILGDDRDRFVADRGGRDRHHKSFSQSRSRSRSTSKP